MAFRSQFTELLTQDMYGWFMESYDGLTPVYPQIFDVQPMDGAYMKETVGVGLGQLSERKEGDDIVLDNPLEGFTTVIKARTFSSSFELSQEFVEDAMANSPQKLKNVLQGFASTWAEGVIQTKETFAANLFNYGGYTSGHDVFNNTITGVIDDASGAFIYDGKPFFALSGNNHPAKNGSTYYNSLANAFSATNLQTAYNLMAVTNAYNERGQKVSLKPQIIVYNPSLRFTIDAVLRNTDTANIRSNVENLVKPIEWDYLTDTDAWFLGVPKKGIKFYERKAPVIDFYQNETNKKYYATIDMRFGAGVTNWRFWQANNISTS